MRADCFQGTDDLPAGLASSRRAAEVGPLAAPALPRERPSVLDLFIRRVRARRADNQMLAVCRVDLTHTDLGEGRAQTMSDEAIADLNPVGVLPRGSSRRIHVHPFRA